MSRKLTNDEFKQRIYNLVGNEYTFLDPYQGVDTKIKCQHNLCGNVWLIRPANFYHGHRCPKCSHQRGANTKLKTTKWFKDQVKSLVGDEYSVISEYVKASVKVKMKHNKCGHVWEITPNNFLKGRRCPNCKSKVLSKNWYKNHKSNVLTKDEAEKRIKNSRNPYLRILGDFKGTHKKILVQCKTCGNKWYARFDDVIRYNNGCPFCNIEPKGESFIRLYLDKIGIGYERQKTFSDLLDKQSLSYDFYIPSLKYLIEYQGGQHYFPVRWLGGEKRFKRQKYHDMLKYNYAIDNNYTLICVPYLCRSYEQVINFLKEWDIK